MRRGALDVVEEPERGAQELVGARVRRFEPVEHREQLVQRRGHFVTDRGPELSVDFAHSITSSGRASSASTSSTTTRS